MDPRKALTVHVYESNLSLGAGWSEWTAITLSIIAPHFCVPELELHCQLLSEFHDMLSLSGKKVIVSFKRGHIQGVSVSCQFHQ